MGVTYYLHVVYFGKMVLLFKVLSCSAVFYRFCERLVNRIFICTSQKNVVWCRSRFPRWNFLGILILSVTIMEPFCATAVEVFRYHDIFVERQRIR